MVVVKETNIRKSPSTFPVSHSTILCLGIASPPKKPCLTPSAYRYRYRYQSVTHSMAPPTISSLPWEIISHILTLAANANIAEGYTPSYTYGLSQVSRTLRLYRKWQIQKHVTGRLPTDTLRWKATDSLRRTCSRWHEWAMEYNLKELYVRRWRGGERYIDDFFFPII